MSARINDGMDKYKRYRLRHLDLVKARQKSYRERNMEKVAAKMKLWREKNKTVIRDYMAGWRARNPFCWRDHDPFPRYVLIKLKTIKQLEAGRAKVLADKCRWLKQNREAARQIKGRNVRRQWEKLNDGMIRAYLKRSFGILKPTQTDIELCRKRIQTFRAQKQLRLSVSAQSLLSLSET